MYLALHRGSIGDIVKVLDTEDGAIEELPLADALPYLSNMNVDGTCSGLTDFVCEPLHLAVCPSYTRVFYRNTGYIFGGVLEWIEINLAYIQLGIRYGSEVSEIYIRRCDGKLRHRTLPFVPTIEQMSMVTFLEKCGFC